MGYEFGFVPLNEDVSASVNSVFGRTGAVAASVGDYAAAQVTNAADKSSLSSQIFSAPIIATSASVSGTVTAKSLGLGQGAASVTGSFATLPPASASVSAAVAGTLILGTAFQNKLSYDINMTIYLSVTVNTSGVVSLGVGPTSTPAQVSIISGVTTVGFVAVKFKIPSQYFALLSISGTITDSIAGQFIEAA